MFAPKSITWNHYDLAQFTEIDDIALWKEFLQNREVIDWLEEERIMLQQYELTKLSTDITNSRSVGQAQLISAMERINNANKDTTSSGPIFIYTYIPLNAQQKQATNVHELKEDIFYVPSPELDLQGDTDPEDPNTPPLST